MVDKGICLINNVYDDTASHQITLTILNTKGISVNVKKGEEIAKVFMYKTSRLIPRELPKNLIISNGEKGLGSTNTIINSLSNILADSEVQLIKPIELTKNKENSMPQYKKDSCKKCKILSEYIGVRQKPRKNNIKSTNSIMDIENQQTNFETVSGEVVNRTALDETKN